MFIPPLQPDAAAYVNIVDLPIFHLCNFLKLPAAAACINPVFRRPYNFPARSTLQVIMRIFNAHKKTLPLLQVVAHFQEKGKRVLCKKHAVIIMITVCMLINGNCRHFNNTLLSGIHAVYAARKIKIHQKADGRQAAMVIFLIFLPDFGMRHSHKQPAVIQQCLDFCKLCLDSRIYNLKKRCKLMDFICRAEIIFQRISDIMKQRPDQETLINNFFQMLSSFFCRHGFLCLVLRGYGFQHKISIFILFIQNTVRDAVIQMKII